MVKRTNKGKAGQLVSKGLLMAFAMAGIVVAVGYTIFIKEREKIEREIKRLRKQHKYKQAKELQRELNKGLCWMKSKSRKKTSRKNPRKK